MKNSAITFKFIITISLVGMLCYIGVDMYLASMTDIARYFETSYAKVQLSLTFYLFAMGIGQLFFGPIIDYYGRKVALFSAITIYALCSIFITFSANIELFLLFRIIQGLGVALIYVCIISMVRDVAKDNKAAQIYAIIISIGAITPILAPAIGGYIAQEFSWEAVFYVLFAFSFFMLIIAFFTLEETLKIEDKVKINFKNILIIYANILQNRKFLVPTLATCLMYMFVFAYIAGASFAYREIYNLDAKTFGLVFGATGSALLLGALISGKLLKLFSMKQLSLSGSLLMVFGGFISLISANLIGLDGIVIGFFLACFGLGLSEASLFSIAMSSQEKFVGFTAALLGSLQLILPSFATLIAGYLVEVSILYWLGLLFIFSILACLLTFAIFKK